MAKVHVATTINGDAVEFLCEAEETLLDVLRDELRLVGTKEGCSNGNCGACTVILDGVSINACLALGVEMEGRRVLTVEGLAQGAQPHPIPQAYIDEAGFQCGFCTPGFLMATLHLLEHTPDPTEYDIRLNLAGNLCRCTGYDKILRSVQAAAKMMKEVKS